MKNRFAAGLLFALLGAFLMGCAPKEPEPADSTPAGEYSAPLPTETALPETPDPEPEPSAEPEDGDLVDVLDYIPTLYVELKYATQDNFTGQVVYDFENAKLRYGTVKKLAKVQEALLEQGYSLKIWDAFRPTVAQFKLWEICPDGNYVANPFTGYSSHSRGNTVDLTLVTEEGEELPMPSGFDDFSALADRDYSDVSQEAAQYGELLENAMEAQGFQGYQKEWWHYSDGEDYPVVEE